MADNMVTTLKLVSSQTGPHLKLSCQSLRPLRGPCAALPCAMPVQGDALGACQCLLTHTTQQLKVRLTQQVGLPLPSSGLPDGPELLGSAWPPAALAEHVSSARTLHVCQLLALPRFLQQDRCWPLCAWHRITNHGTVQ